EQRHRGVDPAERQRPGEPRGSLNARRRARPAGASAPAAPGCGRVEIRGGFTMASLLGPSFATIAAAAALSSAAAIAADTDGAPIETVATAVQPAPSPEPALWANASVIAESELSKQRGGADLHLNENNASAIVSDNVATN